MFDLILFYIVLLNIYHQPLGTTDTVVALIVTHSSQNKGLFWLVYDIMLHRKTSLELINHLQNIRGLDNSYYL